ncbi:phage holin, LLH family [Dictyobacter formicarum]|nr:phage holin, LLH family [Dictyobacter formicarum]
MPHTELLTSIFLNAFPFLCVIAVWCLKFFEHHLPGKQQEMLEKCVQMAVSMAEQAYDDYGPLEKKQVALRAAIELFNAFHLPVPQPGALNTALEAAVFAVRQTQRPRSPYQDAPTRVNPVVVPVVQAALPEPARS